MFRRRHINLHLWIWFLNLSLNFLLSLHFFIFHLNIINRLQLRQSLRNIPARFFRWVNFDDAVLHEMRVKYHRWKRNF